jgi:hypothetical protein
MQAQTESLKTEYRAALQRVRDTDELSAQIATLKRQLAVAENMVRSRFPWALRMSRPFLLFVPLVAHCKAKLQKQELSEVSRRLTETMTQRAAAESEAGVG